VPIFSISKFFCIFYNFAFWSGNAFLSMLSELNFVLDSAFNHVCGRSYPLAPEGLLKALFWIFTKYRRGGSPKIFEGNVGVYS
jgi:hypothetical protein